MDYSVALLEQVIQYICRQVVAPKATVFQNVKRKSRHSIHLMVRVIHNKFHTSGNLAAVQCNVGRMFDFAVYGLKYNLSDFFYLFIASGIASRIEAGNCNYLVGRSGVELAYETIYLTSKKTIDIQPDFIQNRSPEYWCGWAIAYYQWLKSISFKEIVSFVSISDFLALYSPYHEMPIESIVEKLDKIRKAKQTETNLKKYRLLSGMSQSQLAKASGIPIRTIQQYEQRQKNINHANFETIQKLSTILCCPSSALLEV